MTSFRSHVACALAVFAGLFGLQSRCGGEESRSDVDYEREIKPLLQHKCAACHGALQQKAGLRLDAGQLIRQGGESGAAIHPGDADGSLLIQRITAADGNGRMPPEGQGEKLTTEQTDLLRQWISSGAKSPSNESIPEDPKLYWSYQSPVRVQPPAVSNKAWVRTPIDAFIAAEHERRGLTPTADAPREVWLRRVYLDLIGLPPTRAELNSFVNDSDTNAYETVVDDLLGRPEYGERWGRHWMDVWRYSDWYGSRGINEIRYGQRHIWRWRDWIVESLNRDAGYDEMLVAMLAGDETAAADPDVLRATGFLGRNWYKFDRNVWMFETIEHTSQAFLGVTMRCARCHDHKFDPITQADYYHFRAFFEPHDVRTDPISGSLETEKDATIGPVLREGVARVFDKDGGAKTYLFERGDSRYPDTTHEMSPAVPVSLGSLSTAIHPVELPVEAWYPQLRSAVADGMIAESKKKIDDLDAQITKAQQSVEDSRQAIVRMEEQLSSQPHDVVSESAPAFFEDSFDQQTEQWKPLSGHWAWENGMLRESSVGDFSTIVADVEHPRNFQARVRYRTLAPGNYRSVGFSFDFVDKGNSQDVYTSTGDKSQSIQAFHRKDGQQVYPSNGIANALLSVGAEMTVEITVLEQQLSIRLNGEDKLNYVMPVPRRSGKFALWVHNGSAEFLDIELRELAPTVDGLRLQHQSALDSLAVLQAKRRTTELDVESLEARIVAERSKYSDEPLDLKRQKAVEASRLEREVGASKVAEEVLIAEQALRQIQAVDDLVAAKANPTTSDNAGETQTPESSQSHSSAADLAEAEKKLAEARAKLDAANAAIETPSEVYAPLGEQFPKTSTGRRLALARWMTEPANPRTSRVAVNHIWLRHFGEGIVPSVANFGLNGQRPSHPELLDWLATELVNNNWRMKPLHRMIVLSAAYRQSTSTMAETSSAASNAAVDPSNRFLWRMNSRRMEAEIVRDSVLSIAGSLDLARGGPEIPETEAQTNFRRSVYFRNTPNEKPGLLEAFDVANPNECYRRQESVVPQQALALMNSSLAIDQSRKLAESLSKECGDSDDEQTRERFIRLAFEVVLNRSVSDQELDVCQSFLNQNSTTVARTEIESFPAGSAAVQRIASAVPYQRARENLVHVLFSHNDFVTIR